MNEKKNRLSFTLCITSIVCLLPIVLGFILYKRLPEQIPMQYGFDDQVNWTLPKLPAIFVCPVLMCIINIVYNLTIEKKFVSASVKVQVLLKWIIALIAFPVNCFLILKPAGLELNASSFVIPIVSLLLIIIGNYLPKVQPNSFVGIRAPWINSNPDVWRKTNRFGGFLFVAAGILNLAAGFTKAGKYIFVSSIIAVLLLLLVYSIIAAKKESADRESADQ